MKSNFMFWNKRFLLLIMVLASFAACKKSAPLKSSPAKEISTASYTEDWQEVEAMEKKGLGRSIITKVNQILNKALAENNVTQIFKSLAVRSKYSNFIEEDAELKILTAFENRIDSSEFPLNQLLHSATAELYNQYYQQNRWKFKNRSKTDSFDEKDLRSWSLDKIAEVISYHYKSSLLQKEDLLKFPTTAIKSILNENKFENQELDNNYSLRPSLYDFLAFRALQYFNRNEGRLSSPLNEFQINNYPIFNIGAEFVSIDFSSPDTNSNYYQSAKIYQQLIKAHQNDSDPAALIDFELNRLQFFRTLSKNELKDSLYLKALKQLTAKHTSGSSVDEIDFRIAQLYSQWGYQYRFDELTANKKWYLKKAYDLCKSKEDKKTFGARQCIALMQDLKQQSFSFQTENTYLPGQAVLYNLKYKNVDSLHFRLIKLPYELTAQFENNRSEIILGKLLAKKPIRQWKEKLPNPGDFHEHSIEQSLGALAKGNYYLIASKDSTFKIAKDGFSFCNFKISQISYFSRRSAKGNAAEVYVRDRKSGKAIQKAKVVAYGMDYNYSTRKNTIKRVGSFYSNQEGYVSFSSSYKNENLYFYILTNNDTLSSNSNYYLNSYSSPKKVENIHWFTDRAIYRPGQSVYFKGIVIESNKNSKKVKANSTKEVTLYNVNGEKVSSLKLTTNEYGSFQGSFVLPLGGLNGEYRIQTKRSSHYFSVEEYKRPTFQISIDPNDKQYQINDSMNISGTVQAFSGAAISSAKLQYRIVRKVSYPYWSYLRSFYPPRNRKEIANGVLLTDDEGKFQFNFLARADAEIKKEWNPVFNYELLIDASSPNGETQSTSKNIQLSHQSLFLSSNLKNAVQLEDLKQLLIKAENIEGKAQNSQANLSLWKLKTPTKAKKQKLWSPADQQKFSETEYKTLFPDLPMQAEEKIINFKRDYEISNSLINCNEPLNLFRELKPGAYELLVKTKDSFGKEVELKKRFELFDEKATKPAYPVFSWFHSIQDKVEPGENAELIIASSLKNLQLLYEIDLDGKILKKEWITLNGSQRKISIPVKESYRGGFTVHFTGVHSDRLIQFSKRIDVPFSNKKLKVQLGTFRDKVLPGSKEKWSLSIQGHKGEAVVAELLASMYDQSLDQFVRRNWRMNLYRAHNSRLKWDLNGSFEAYSSIFYSRQKRNHISPPRRRNPSLNWFGFSMGRTIVRGARANAFVADAETGESMGWSQKEMGEYTQLPSSRQAITALNKSEESETKNEKNTYSSANPIRSDFRETVFFYPQLRSNKEGKITFEFEMPDALTQWKFRALAHTKDLKVGQLEQSIRTQKKLMVVPNSPRFFREGDELQFTATVQNLSDQKLSGYVKLKFFDALNGDKIDIFQGHSADLPFNLLPLKNTVVQWSIKIPKGYDVINYKIIAETENYSDGEEKAIPVLPNRMLVTESMPIWVRGHQNKEFTFDKLLNAKSEKTLSHESYTLEFTPNPAWYAIQALPNLSENTKECSEQIFARLYANSLAELIANSNPKIKAVFDQWKIQDSKELTSKLMQNQELKSILIEETPWLQKAKDEGEQKRRIALLFDFNRMAQEKRNAVQKLAELQLPDGGWSWYKGMRANRYITQYILEGLGHLRKLGVNLEEDKLLQQITIKALKYLDQQIADDYKRLKDMNADMSKNHLGRIQVHYLYSRSFFPEQSFEGNKLSYTYYLQQAKSYWKDRSIYEQAMIALAVNRNSSKSKVATEILISLSDRALQSEELGMYWKSNVGGYYWHQAAIETQALMIELYEEIDAGKPYVEELKIWLLKQKQTQSWSNSKATAAACYALFLNGVDILSADSEVNISVGNESILSNQQTKEAGTNYFKKHWSKHEVKSSLAKVKIEKQSEGIAWGAAYWQYYQDLDQISSSDEGSLKLSKTIFKQRIDKNGKTIVPIDASAIEIGDKIIVRIRLETDRNLEFVHLKDMRASAFEPINTLSSYRYQDGLGYYQSTKDASTNFFIDWLPKGVYVFEYELRASLVGEFSNGISSIQCQYAPEFAAHSQGKRIKIKQQ